MFYFHATSLVLPFKVHVHVVHPSIIWSRKRGGDSFDVISHAAAAAASACLAYRRTVNEKSAQRDANTARALAVVRFGHRPPARPPVANTRVTDRTDYNTLRRS